MTHLVLDTTFLVDIERGDVELDDVIGDADDVAVAAITMAELRVGVQLSTGTRRRRRAAYVEAVAAAIPVLPYDEPVAIDHAELLAAVRRARRPRSAHDLVIAGTALTHGRTIVSADRRAFAGLPGVIAIDHRDGAPAGRAPTS